MSDSLKILELKERKANYLQAEVALLKGAQSYAIGTRSLTRAQLSEVRKQISEIDAQLESLENGAIQVFPVRPMDLI